MFRLAGKKKYSVNTENPKLLLAHSLLDYCNVVFIALIEPYCKVAAELREHLGV
jgi:hypothetical protein